MFVKLIKSYRNIVAVCDEEILGKKFEEGKLQLEVKENFYKGEQIEKEDLLNLFKKMKLEDSTFNIVGNKSTSIAVEAGIVNKKDIGRIQGIPFVLVLV